jgi:hypothetical protein
MLATLEMDFTVVVYTKERRNRFLRLVARSNMAAVAREMDRPSYEEETDRHDCNF